MIKRHVPLSLTIYREKYVEVYLMDFDYALKFAASIRIYTIPHEQT